MANTVSKREPAPALGPAFSQFFRDLAAHNEREWFAANKKRFEREVRDPFHALVSELLEQASALDGLVYPEAAQCVFRIYRDTRFSKDKTPYKMHMGALISPGGRKDMQNPGFYVQAEAERLFLAGGCYMPDKTSLLNIRRHLTAHPKEVKSLLADPDFRARFPAGIAGERNKILPPEFRDQAVREPLLFQKQFYFFAEYAGEEAVTRPDAAGFIMEHFRAAAGWTQFLRQALETEAD